MTVLNVIIVLFNPTLTFVHIKACLHQGYFCLPTRQCNFQRYQHHSCKPPAISARFCDLFHDNTGFQTCLKPDKTLAQKKTSKRDCCESKNVMGNSIGFNGADVECMHFRHSTDERLRKIGYLQQLI